MTLNSILNEVNVEFGNGQSLAVIDALKPIAGKSYFDFAKFIYLHK